MSLLLAVLFATAQQVELPAPPRGYGTAAAEVVVDAAGVLVPKLRSVLHYNGLPIDARSITEAVLAQEKAGKA